jgi:hypothetical protein
MYDAQGGVYYMAIKRRRLAEMGFNEISGGNKLDETTVYFYQILKISKYSDDKQYFEYYYNAVMFLWRSLAGRRDFKDKQWFDELVGVYTKSVDELPSGPKDQQQKQTMVRDMTWEFTNEVFERCILILIDKGLSTENQFLEIIGETS